MLKILVLVAITQIANSHVCNVSFFPPDFKFGAGTAAYQVEGAWNEDGKGRSWWDWFSNNYPQYTANETGNVACDMYHKFREDVALMKEIGLDHYRFSLSWSRILPKGFDNEINQAGVDFYNNLLDELEAAGIEPLVTLFHYDTPMSLQYLGGFWTNPKIVDYFVEYADLAFQLFGHRVKLWSTINEPKTICQILPDRELLEPFPDLSLGTLEYLCGHHALLGHAKVYKLYQKKYKPTQKGRIAITLSVDYAVPLTNCIEDLEAVDRYYEFEFGWLARPIFFGDYPQIMKDVVAKNSKKQNFTKSRLPKFTAKEKKLVKGSYDLVMINTYTAFQVTPASYNNEPSFLNDEQISTSSSEKWPPTATATFRVYPEGIRYILKYIKEKYNNPEIIITENGYNDATGELNDTLRINFIRDTLQNVRLAMCEDGVNVSRYTYWALMDSLEWTSGYSLKFGLLQVNRQSPNLTRTMKKSAYYYKNLIKTHYINSTASKNNDYFENILIW